ncbi:MAG: pyridine nucleotide-disulfide oxidoreductase [Betaproteobacteria bacterium]|nr:pyridine nucleotide-disulfide oxidoreductase [Betaproteobacteria bacterium]
MSKAALRWMVGLLLLLAALAAYVGFDLGQYLRLEYFKAQQEALGRYRDAQPLGFAAAFFLAYVLMAAFSLPGAALMTLLAGALFGLGWGLLLVSFASSAGATLAFLASRLLFRDFIQRRLAERLRAVDEGVRRQGAFYLFALRLVPAFPFFLVNLMMGLTPMRAWTFYWVSQLGMLAGTLVFVNAGTQLARIESLSGLLSPCLIASFVLLGVFPLLARHGLEAIQRRKVYAGWRRPRRFDCNLLVIGAGSGGLVSAYIAAAVKAKVTLVQEKRMGGDCLNTGCVPSKALIRTARILGQARRAKDFGLRSIRVEMDFGEVMARVQRVIRDIAPHDSIERYTSLGVECLQGRATLVSPWEVDITAPDGRTQRRSSRAIVIATGAQPFIPPVPGIEAMDCLTSNSVWELRELPARLLVLGGGPIGCELAQCFARLGSRVTQVEMLPRLLMREDPEVSALVERRLGADGVGVLTGHKAVRFAVESGEKVMYCEPIDGARGGDTGTQRIAFDVLLCAVGRTPRAGGFGLEKLGIPLTRTGSIAVNEFMQTKYPNILACGDVAGPYQFTHTAAHTAWYAVVNGLFSGFRRFRADFSVIPWATFTDPEVARVGLSEGEARELGVHHEVTRYGIDDLDRAIADGAAEGFVKVLTVPGSDRILGATIVGEHAGELITEFVSAMRNRIGLNRLLGTIHVYPTWSEANKYAAGAWKRAHTPAGLLRWAERYHAWRRR